MNIGVGDVVRARGREWTAVTPLDPGIGLIVADPHFTDEECARIKRVSDVNDKKGTAIPVGVFLQRDVLDIEQEQVEVAH